MCNICFAIENKIGMIDTNVATLCDTHYRDWSEEKNLGEY
jgi:hypothetical protein